MKLLYYVASLARSFHRCVYSMYEYRVGGRERSTACCFRRVYAYMDKHVKMLANRATDLAHTKCAR